MRLIFSFALLFFSAISWSQEITVLDKESQQPIFNVAIFNKDKSKSILTNFDGRANLSQFSPGEIIFFRHVSHKEFHSTKKQILQRNNQVLLAPGENT
ncbi:MAG TPA: TonB-dependent receptor, partial [Salinimicrobium catena]|nr:TonB-dependent receptor [Salinimicrobium catena]